jgi:hypothetical protein
MAGITIARGQLHGVTPGGSSECGLNFWLNVVLFSLIWLHQDAATEKAQTRASRQEGAGGVEFLSPILRKQDSANKNALYQSKPFVAHTHGMIEGVAEKPDSANRGLPSGK